MSTYTRQQVADAHFAGIEAANMSGHKLGDIKWVWAYRDAYTAALGLTVEDPKPEPGTVHLTDMTNCPAYVAHGGALVVINEDGSTNIYREAHTWPPLTPARVVPAEPVELTEEQVGELWDVFCTNDAPIWDDYADISRRRWATLANAALAKYGHGGTRALPSLEEVERKIRFALPDHDEDFSTVRMARSVMALFECGTR